MAPSGLGLHRAEEGLTPENITIMRQMYANGTSQHDLGLMFGVERRVIDYAINGDGPRKAG